MKKIENKKFKLGQFRESYCNEKADSFAEFLTIGLTMSLV